jgi:hypothetical protein
MNDHLYFNHEEFGGNPYSMAAMRNIQKRCIPDEPEYFICPDCLNTSEIDGLCAECNLAVMQETVDRINRLGEEPK